MEEGEHDAPSTRRQQKLQKRAEDETARRQKDRMNLTGNKLRVGEAEDPEEICLPGQKWFLVSFTGPVGANQRSKNLMVKFRGAFDTWQEAEEHSKKVFEADPDFDVHIFKANAWIQLPPPKDHYDAVPMKYNQEKLDKIMEGYYAQQKKAATDIKNRVANAKKTAAKKNKELREKAEREKAEEEKKDLA